MLSVLKAKTIVTTDNNEVIYKYSGHLFFAFYLFFCGYYYLERTLPFDGAFYSFKIIRENSFNIENGRWGAFYTQILPVICLKFGVTLKTFLFLYSVSFGICNYAIYLVLQHYFKYSYVSLAFILSLLIGYKHSFFYPVSEIHSTIPLLFLFWALLIKFITSSNFKKGLIWFSICSLLIVWLSKTHVISIFPVAFIIVYQLFDEASLKSFKRSALVALVSILVYGIVLLLIPKNSYESSKMISLESIKSVFISLDNHYGFDFFKGEFHRNYYLPSVLLIVSVIYLAFKRKPLKVILLISSVIGFWVIIMAYTRLPDGPYNYQNYYCYLGIFISIPLCRDLLSKLNSKFFLIIISLIVFHSFYKIVKAGLRFSDRKEFELRCINNMRQYQGSKFIISDTNFFQDMVWAWWNFSFESLLLSSIDNPNNSISFFSSQNEKEYMEKSKADKNIFIGVNFAPYWFSVSDINASKKFFQLNESSYLKTNSLQDNNFADTIFNNNNLKIHLSKNYHLMRSEFRIITILVENLTDSVFKSQITENKKIRLSYRLKNMDGKIIVEEGYRSPLEMDIPPNSSIQTGLVLALYNVSRGRYELEVDFVHENERWFNINSKSYLTIY